MTALVLAIFLMLTCSPCRANSPWSCATYRPARSAEGMAATVMFRSPGLDSAFNAASLCAVVHPARTVITAAASRAAPKFRLFIFAPPGSAGDPGLACRCISAPAVRRQRYQNVSCWFSNVINGHDVSNAANRAPSLARLTSLIATLAAQQPGQRVLHPEPPPYLVQRSGPASSTGPHGRRRPARRPA